MQDIERIKELVSILNKHRNSYYNEQKSIISDFEYDRLFDELKSLEEETGIILSNSPTVTVGYEVKSELVKVKHSHPMLSLDKTKDTEVLKKFAGTQDCILSTKLDGLTILLTYDNGELVQAETRGSGEEGEIITHNAKVFDNIPLHIDYKGRLEIEGEAIITYDDFDKINSLIENPDDKYKNPRNLASGSVRQLDSSIAAQRHIKFIAWKVPSEIDNASFNNSFFHRLKYVQSLGFDIVPLLTYANGTYDEDHIEEMIESLKNYANNHGYPIDGLVMTYNDVEYGESLGATSHHPKHSIAFKFYDEEVETILEDIEWTMGKTGILTPTAVFKPVEIDGTIVGKASLHNISILNEILGKTPYIGQKITVYKANQIIPQVLNADKSYFGIQDFMLDIPTKCPICGGDTKIKQENSSQVLICTNDNCKGKLLGKLTHFVSKNAMDIQGLSEATLKKFVELRWLDSFVDIYNLKKYKYDMMKYLDGFGEKSTKKLLDAIEESRNTTLDRFINALGIPMIGKSASKTISKYCDGDYDKFYDLAEHGFDWTQLEDFGETMCKNLNEYLDKHFGNIDDLAGKMHFVLPKVHSTNTSLDNKTFVITGSLNTFTNRDAAKEWIETHGGKVSGSVSAKTSYLVNNNIISTSGKNKKAIELGIKIITEDELRNMVAE